MLFVVILLQELSVLDLPGRQMNLWNFDMLRHFGDDWVHNVGNNKHDSFAQTEQPNQLSSTSRPGMK